MVSFRAICEASERSQGRDFWDYKKKEDPLGKQAMATIMRGLEIRPDREDGQTFWDDFITVLGNNSEGASQLLGVSSDIISGWSSTIKKALDKVRDDNAENDDRAEVIQTGEQ